MPKLMQNILAVFAGLIIGGIVNMALIQVSPSLIPPPPGVDVNNVDSLNRGIHLFQARHFIMPFLAHALGTLTGALATCVLAASGRTKLPYVIGGLNFCGGVAASFMIPAPTWFMALDLIAAYWPMAWLGMRLGTRMKPENG